jgi:DNA (cytosine-5)-methyltransferase 1
MVQLYSYKLGTHRGNKRLWLEGKKLLDNNFVCDKRYNITYAKNYIMIEFNEHGTHKINGTVKRPIIDINNRKLSATFNTDMVSVEFDVDNLIIKGEL